MKNKRLSQVLYVFSVVALVYMGYTLFYSYDSITAYYAVYSSQAPVTEIFTSLISSAFTPFCMALIFYALGTIVGLLQGIRNEFEIAANQEEEKNSAENQEEIKAAEEPKEIEENTPSENSAQEEKEELPADKDPDQK